MSLQDRYSFLNRFNPESLYNTFTSLPPREQLVALGGAILIVILIVVLPISLASSHLSSLEDRIGESQVQINEIVREISVYDRVSSELKSINALLQKGSASSISSTIEGLAESSAIKENVDAIKERPVTPSDLFDELTVDVTVSKVTLEQLIDFLFKIENSRDQVLRIRKMQIKVRHDNRNLLNANFSVSSYKPTGDMS